MHKNVDIPEKLNKEFLDKLKAGMFNCIEQIKHDARGPIRITEIIFKGELGKELYTKGKFEEAFSFVTVPSVTESKEIKEIKVTWRAGLSSSIEIKAIQNFVVIENLFSKNNLILVRPEKEIETSTIIFLSKESHEQRKEKSIGVSATFESVV